MWDPSSPTRNGTVSPALEGGLLTTEPPGKSLHEVLKSHFPVPYSLVFLVDASPQSSMFWGLSSQVLLKNFYLFFGPATWLAGSLFSAQGSNLGSRQWKRGVLTTGPPGNSLSSQVLIVGVLHVGLRPFTSQVGAPGLVSPLDCGLPDQGWARLFLSLSHPRWCDLFLVCLMYKSLNQFLGFIF